MENNNNQYPENSEEVNFNNLDPVVETTAKEKEETVEEGATPTNTVVETNAEEKEYEPEYVNTSGIEPDDVELFTITQDSVTEHLQNRILGVPIHCDYQRWDGTKDNAYVLMRIAVPAAKVSEKASAKVSNNPYMQQSLENNAAGIYMAEKFLKKLEPFMYPKNMSSVNTRQDIVDYLTKIGLTAERYNQYINDFVDPRLSRDRETGIEYFVLVLQADEIIQHMINLNPRTGKKYGKFEIIKVAGGDCVTDNFGRPISYTPITWKCSIDMNSGMSSYNGSLGISMNEIFMNANTN